MDVSKQVSKS